MRVYRTESYKMIKMYLKIQDIFNRPNEFYQTCQVVRHFCEVCLFRCINLFCFLLYCKGGQLRVSSVVVTLSL